MKMSRRVNCLNCRRELGALRLPPALTTSVSPVFNGGQYQVHIYVIATFRHDVKVFVRRVDLIMCQPSSNLWRRAQMSTCILEPRKINLKYYVLRFVYMRYSACFIII
ncbi:hypothetical protein O3G_MSEX007630 [Manduca sexta]|uniref:Uncharacterized protein n=1 Tax=Manduca sexta TaxID=7130 RepID=A0A922CNI0_MANSE|nr:hypothetical protein O3G_MSEX007630 [Manduca sexta]